MATENGTLSMHDHAALQYAHLSAAASGSESVGVVSSTGDVLLTSLKSSVRQQVEYYFSKQNLGKDAYMLSHMDSEGYIPLSVIANFKKIKSLTSDLEIIIQAITDEQSTVCELNNERDKIKASWKKAERTTLILREVPEEVTAEEIEQLLRIFGVKEVKKDVLRTWFVTMENQDAAKNAIEFLMTATLHGQEIKCRLKSETIIQQAKQLEPHSNEMAFGFTAAGINAQPYSYPMVQQQYYPQNMMHHGPPQNNTAFSTGQVYPFQNFAQQTAVQPNGFSAMHGTYAMLNSYPTGQGYSYAPWNQPQVHPSPQAQGYLSTVPDTVEPGVSGGQYNDLRTYEKGSLYVPNDLPNKSVIVSDRSRERIDYHDENNNLKNTPKQALQQQMPHLMRPSYNNRFNPNNRSMPYMNSNYSYRKPGPPIKRSNSGFSKLHTPVSNGPSPQNIRTSNKANVAITSSPMDDLPLVSDDSALHVDANVYNVGHDTSKGMLSEKSDYTDSGVFMNGLQTSQEQTYFPAAAPNDVVQSLNNKSSAARNLSSNTKIINRKSNSLSGLENSHRFPKTLTVKKSKKGDIQKDFGRITPSAAPEFKLQDFPSLTTGTVSEEKPKLQADTGKTTWATVAKTIQKLSISSSQNNDASKEAPVNNKANVEQISEGHSNVDSEAELGSGGEQHLGKLTPDGGTSEETEKNGKTKRGWEQKPPQEISIKSSIETAEQVDEKKADDASVNEKAAEKPAPLNVIPPPATVWGQKKTFAAVIKEAALKTSNVDQETEKNVSIEKDNLNRTGDDKPSKLRRRRNRKFKAAHGLLDNFNAPSNANASDQNQNAFRRHNRGNGRINRGIQMGSRTSQSENEVNHRSWPHKAVEING